MKRNPLTVVWQICRRELKSYFQSPLAYFILSISFSLAFLWGYAYIRHESTSTLALQRIFYMLSGTTMITGVLISMRLIAEEKMNGTIELLFTSPISEAQLVTGKFLSALLFLVVQAVVTLPIALLVVVFGGSNLGHVAAGFLGVLLIGAAVAAMGTFYSSLTKTQLLAALMTAANLVFFLLLGFFSPFIDQPLKSVLRELSFYVHFMDFEKGVISVKHMLFYFSIIILYLYAASMVLASRRWR
ncbi:ABC transporter permease [Turneriella parva]|uniref:ABC-2 type transporter n=1 Tax=Turneriella parva (strain ATCC BAA-1111 / DSM 21527 / NCTC 11395 / H) TaxID=869212 RepID=I4B7U7_TURPD|nr:ABC transporter permease [Turneriella parva]AFM13354.1 ABC-2 type transporter [Turneriella parva DSM 21527]